MFARGSGHGLLQLATNEAGSALPPGLGWWRDFGARYVTSLRSLPANDIDVPLPPEGVWARLLDEAPPMKGGEYLTSDVLAALWGNLNTALSVELAETGLSTEDFLKRRNPSWNAVGRVHFNLAENRKDEDWPFAFLATYTTGVSAHGQAKHLPLGQALREFAGTENKPSLLKLLLPVQRATETCSWLKAMVDSGEIFHPLRWKPQDAIHFLHDAAALEAAGVVVRMPANWRMNRPARPVVKAIVGGKA
ncbi:MAG TPA: SNF2 helicase-associated domain-containing protein, partial [Candidatus Binataceae bacterium]|nr:SNF2 helicase-associated domain-containing protein [Candidatus Binataceae bacterium]